jgi:hypothetical protein
MTDELEMDLKGNFHCLFSGIYRYLPGETEEHHETTVRMASILAEIQTSHFLDTRLQRYRYAKGLSV